MNKNEQSPLHRPEVSRVLSGIRRPSRDPCNLLPPGHRMEAAFTLSMDVLELRIAGLRAQGFPDPEIRAILNTGRQ